MKTAPPLTPFSRLLNAPKSLSSQSLSLRQPSSLSPLPVAVDQVEVGVGGRVGEDAVDQAGEGKREGEAVAVDLEAAGEGTVMQEAVATISKASAGVARDSKLASPVLNSVKT